jgi:hypothetical protein
LQDESGRVLVNHGGPFGAADIGCDQFTFDCGG